jgi:signal transduction histidine kinase
MRSAVIICKVKDDGENFIIQNVNNATELIEKDNKANIIGKNLKEFINNNSQIDLLEIIKQVWISGKPENVAINGEYKINNWRDNYYVYKLSSNQIVVIYDDISEIIEYQKKISENERIMSEAIELENFKTEFFANISHELRTPLNIILSAIQIDMLMLEDKDNFFDRKKIINNINIEKQNCFRLLRLINNLIDSTKLDLRNIEPVMVNCNIVNIVEEISQSVAKYISGNNLSLTFDTNIEEKIISCDLDKIERIMLNLLSNSIKFTEPGGSIFVNFIDGDEFVTITVEDTGIGIEENKLNVIFDRFRQVDKSFSRRNEGSGIGLSLVKSLVEIHNGSISVESTLGLGTKFIIKLPANKVTEDNYNAEKSKLSYEIFNNRVEKIKIEFSDIYKLMDNMKFA